ncbi:hypothetical protein BDZ90DRAFT_129377 [Jaminaea rosea]|uniref:SWI/SNF and RSC complexes subunit Ssr4 C-terminal domain-containing protein n=1 Tax=Jaminaea rosea TaxID=1569628 RepID=A0A316UTV6_9BASI|nr:hypothetical protein BDZ90DRAFT_129377 [Jaminaea rosea]PWN28736.1 hypothetical protein BDZ90DRAFT_129377 [Jaminaea rosea]
MSTQDHHAAGGSSRKMKRKAGPGASASRHANHQQHHQQQQQHQQQGRPSAGQPMNMHPPLHGGAMGWGSAFDDDQTDFVLDEMDRLTPRDLAVARFRRNHELMEGIFDERKIAKLVPPPSPYSVLSPESLRIQLRKAQETAEEMTKVHAERLASLRESLNPERIEADLEQARKRARQDDESAEPWARAPGEGRTLARGGLVYVRARTPEPVRRERLLEQHQLSRVLLNSSSSPPRWFHRSLQQGPQSSPLLQQPIQRRPSRTAKTRAKTSSLYRTRTPMEQQRRVGKVERRRTQMQMQRTKTATREQSSISLRPLRRRQRLSLTHYLLRRRLLRKSRPRVGRGNSRRNQRPPRLCSRMSPPLSLQP